MNDRIVLGDIANPLFEFWNTEQECSIYNISYTQSVDVVGSELSIDVMIPIVDYPFNTDSAQVIGGPDFLGIGSSDGYIMSTSKKYSDLRLIKYGTPVRYYRENELVVKAYIKNVQRTGKATYKLNAVSVIGLLDTQTHYGGMYQSTTFGAVLSEVIGAGIPYTIESDVAATIVQRGYLPYGTRRENLHQLLFAYGVTVGRNANGDMHFKWLDNSSSTVIPDSRVYIGGDVDYSALASEVQVTEHGYMELPTDETVVEYDNTDGSETANHTLLVFRNAPLHDLTTTGTLTIDNNGTSCGVNYAIITGTGTLSGKKYTHTTRVLSKEAENSENIESNVVSVDKCTMITVLNSNNVIARLLAFYASRKTVKTSIVMDGERPGDLLALHDPYNEVITGFLSRVDANVSSITKGDCTLITDFEPTQGGNAFTAVHLYDGSELTHIIDFDALLALYPQKSNDLIQVTLIGGGTGGNRGANGSRATLQAGGTGGIGGAGGDGAKVYVITFHVNDLTSHTLSYTIGTGGSSEEAGSATTLGSWSSDDGDITTYGVANIFSGAVYGVKGDAGIAGASGGGYNQAGGNVTADGQTWHGGTPQHQYIYYGLGGGGGAAVGANGSDGYRQGGTGGSATAPTPETEYGKGGKGGNGGGGGGSAGENDDGERWDTRNGDGGLGSVGGVGGPGLLMVYV